METVVPEALRTSDKKLIKSVAHGIKDTLDSMSDIAMNSDAEKELVKIVMTARELDNQLHSQKGDYVVEMMPARIQDEIQPFMPASMEALGTGEDDIKLAGKPIGLSVFPVLYKTDGLVSLNLELQLKRTIWLILRRAARR
jgi:hypothetical protein